MSVEGLLSLASGSGAGTGHYGGGAARALLLEGGQWLWPPVEATLRRTLPRHFPAPPAALARRCPETCSRRAGRLLDTSCEQVGHAHELTDLVAPGVTTLRRETSRAPLASLN